METALTLESAVARFGVAASRKLRAISTKGHPEDQLRSPLESLFCDLAELAGVGRNNVVVIGETPVEGTSTRPDFALELSGALVGFIEVKAPGKGADPRKYRDAHDKSQWAHLREFPNLIYTDGNEFSLWSYGELIGKVVRLDGDIAAGDPVSAAPGLNDLFTKFFGWKPTAPKSPKELAEITARVCRLMRDEVSEQLALDNPALTSLAAEWRLLLFPDADNKRFADGYAQAVTFGLLIARARGISVSEGVNNTANALGTKTLIGAALLVLTNGTEENAAVRTSVSLLTRLLEVVDWQAVAKGNPEAWLYFYEDFLAIYDSTLRKQTGSYYTPPEVVTAMVRLVESALRSRFGKARGLAESDVTLIDPAVGTGTYLLAALRSIARTTEADQGAGVVGDQIQAALERLIGFEIQLGPFAVAQLRLLAELKDLGVEPSGELRMYVADTLANPFVEEEKLGSIYEPIAESRRQANTIKKDQPVLVVIGNPPYKEKAKGRGGWIESGQPEAKVAAPLADWNPPKEWRAGAHTKHLRNLYVYFWRWATWKVFDRHPEHDTGIVSFITTAGYIGGLGFQKMRQYLRETADEIWVIDCSPEGHQASVNTRIFQAVQQPVSIVMVSRSGSDGKRENPARVWFRSLPPGDRTEKFQALAEVELDGDGWQQCPSEWRAPFLPTSSDSWSSYPLMSELFVYDGSGVMPGRTWVIAPDAKTLEDRWNTLISSSDDAKQDLFHPHLNSGGLGDRHVDKVVKKGLAGHPHRSESVAGDRAAAVPPMQYGFRTLDRQWIIPDVRLINRPNPSLWAAWSPVQIHLTALESDSPTSGPAATVTELLPDLSHYKGSFGGRVYPLWLDDRASVSNLKPGLLTYLTSLYGMEVAGADLYSYVVGITSHPAFVSRFEVELVTPGLRIPLTADAALFSEVVEVGRTCIWLQTFGERMVDADAGRPPGKPRLPDERAPRIPADGVISTKRGDTADMLSYDPAENRLHVGGGYVDHVTPAIWEYNVSGKQVLGQWFSYRGRHRERPLIGDKRPPSRLEEVRPDRWLPEYTTDLLDLLHVIGNLCDLEAAQALLLEVVCSGELVALSDLMSAGALDVPKDFPEKPFASGILPFD